MSNHPIGLFDSGVGGLSVLSVLKHNFPNESFIYIGDTARAPYGDRSVDNLWDINEELIQELLNQNIKALVMACNTSCALFLSQLQSSLNIPVIGLIPAAAKAAVQASKTGRIAILGTTRTIEQQQHKKEILRHAPNATVIEKASPELVPIIESSVTKTDLDQPKALHTFKEILTHTPDVLIHGCTHYPFLEPVWQHYLDQIKTPLTFINPATAIIDEIKKEIPLAPLSASPSLKITCTGDPLPFQQFLQTHSPLLNKDNLC